MKNTIITIWTKIYQFLKMQCNRLFFSTKMRSRISLAILALFLLSLISYWSYLFVLYIQHKRDIEFDRQHKIDAELDCQWAWNQIKEIWEKYNDKLWSWYEVKDGRVYYHHVIWSTLDYDLVLTEIDVDGFHVMSSWYVRDKNYIYYAWRRVENAGYCSFEVSIFENVFGMSEWFARDAKHVYNGWKIMEGADAATFERVNSFYFKDKNHIYHRSWVIVDKIDPNAFY